MTEVKVYYSEYGAFLLQKKETQSTFDLLDMKKIEYTKIAVDDAANAEAREEMAQISGTKKLPQIHIKKATEEKFVFFGGWDALSDANEDGDYSAFD